MSLTLLPVQSRTEELSDHVAVAGPVTSAVRPARILVIEDERDIAMSILMRLKHMGFEVHLAADGYAGTNAIRQLQPDVILLDIGLPCGSGFEVAERLKDISSVAIPVIFLTARTSDEDRRQAEELGAFAYLTKPFEAEDLLTAIYEALDA